MSTNLKRLSENKSEMKHGNSTCKLCNLIFLAACVLSSEE